jgi:hypothetical protein
MLDGIAAPRLKGTEVRIKVKELEAQFYVDPQNRLVFTCTNNLQVHTDVDNRLLLSC